MNDFAKLICLIPIHCRKLVCKITNALVPNLLRTPQPQKNRNAARRETAQEKRKKNCKPWDILEKPERLSSHLLLQSISGITGVSVKLVT